MSKQLFTTFIFILIVLLSCEKSDDTVDNTILKDGYGTLEDVEGNIYNIVKIGNQWWMAENLKTTRLNSGKLIFNDLGNTQWISDSSANSCWYNNDQFYDSKNFGLLYNWYAVETGLLCPKGWHIPSSSEWDQLRNYVDSITSYDVSKPYIGNANALKDVQEWDSIGLWSDDFGFSALPGGMRDYQGQFSSIGYQGNWWSSTEHNKNNSWNYNMMSNRGHIISSPYNKIYGLSCRCVMD